MLLGLFVVLIGLSLFLVGLGYYSKEASYSLIGFGFLFILASFVLLPGNVQVTAGSNTTETYVYGVNSTMTSATKSTVNTYTNFNDTTSRSFGIWMTVLAFTGIAVTLFEIRGKKEKDSDDKEDDDE